MTYFLGVCIGGVVEMDIWSQIFAEKSNILIKFCVRTDGGGGGGGGQPNGGGGGGGGGGGRGSQPNVGRYGQRGGEPKIMALINTTVYRKPTNTDIHITVTHIHIPPKS